MNRLSKRLEVLASFINKNDSLVDVGCDHGYLSIYLCENNFCQNVICSDVNENALNSAINNIKNSNLDIKYYLSDGLNNVPMDHINTIVISGMGTSTIISILKNNKKLETVDKIILQSNNNHEELRKFMNNIGYYLQEEKYTLDNRKWYASMLFIKSDKKNNKKEIKYGYINKEYGDYLINAYKNIIKKIPDNSPDYEKFLKMIKEIETIIY